MFLLPHRTLTHAESTATSIFMAAMEGDGKSFNAGAASSKWGGSMGGKSMAVSDGMTLIDEEPKQSFLTRIKNFAFGSGRMGNKVAPLPTGGASGSKRVLARSSHAAWWLVSVFYQMILQWDRPTPHDRPTPFTQPSFEVSLPGPSPQVWPFFMWSVFIIVINSVEFVLLNSMGSSIRLGTGDKVCHRRVRSLDQTYGT